MSFIKTQSELQTMRVGGGKLAGILNQLLKEVKVGVKPAAIEELAQKLIRKAHGSPSFMTVNGYKWATCISVNDGVVHGIPNGPEFRVGDVVSIDIGLLYEGIHTDTSWSTLVVGEENKEIREKKHFLHTGETALNRAIRQTKSGNRIGHISKAIQTSIEDAGYKVVTSLVGHGIGKKLHESPQVPGILRGDINKTPELKAGMTLAIEVIYSQSCAEVVYVNDDGWTLGTADGSLAGLFEHTVEITPKGPIILTRS